MTRIWYKSIASAGATNPYEQLTPQIYRANCGWVGFPRSVFSNHKGSRPLNPEQVRHLLYGRLAAIDRTIKILHALGYADPNGDRDPIPVCPGRPVDWLRQAPLLSPSMVLWPK